MKKVDDKLPTADDDDTCFLGVFPEVIEGHYFRFWVDSNVRTKYMEAINVVLNDTIVQFTLKELSLGMLLQPMHVLTSSGSQYTVFFETKPLRIQVATLHSICDTKQEYLALRRYGIAMVPELAAFAQSPQLNIPGIEQERLKVLIARAKKEKISSGIFQQAVEDVSAAWAGATKYVKSKLSALTGLNNE